MTVILDASPEFKALLAKLEQQQSSEHYPDVIRRAIALYDEAVAKKRAPFDLSPRKPDFRPEADVFGNVGPYLFTQSACGLAFDHGRLMEEHRRMDAAFWRLIDHLTQRDQETLALAAVVDAGGFKVRFVP